MWQVHSCGNGKGPLMCVNPKATIWGSLCWYNTVNLYVCQFIQRQNMNDNSCYVEVLTNVTTEWLATANEQKIDWITETLGARNKWNQSHSLLLSIQTIECSKNTIQWTLRNHFVSAHSIGFHKMFNQFPFSAIFMSKNTIIPVWPLTNCIYWHWPLFAVDKLKLFLSIACHRIDFQRNSSFNRVFVEFFLYAPKNKYAQVSQLPFKSVTSPNDNR